MTKLSAVPIDFRNDNGNLVPADPDLHALVTQYCTEKFAQEMDLRNLLKRWAIVEFGENQEILKIHMVFGVKMVPDVPLFGRAEGPCAGQAIALARQRLNDYLADNGWRGQEVFLFINDKETNEQRCANWDSALRGAGAVPAQRFAVTVR